ncbi:MAG: DUF4160 domain-containing protein [Thermoanaerobaculia bacterium]
MPTISRFFGIEIRMYYEDHAPPHFHAFYSGRTAALSIVSLEVLRGELTPRAYRMVLEWAIEHRSELLENWRRAEAHEVLSWIEPLA